MKPLAWRATALYGAVTVALGALGPWLLAVQGAEEQNTSEHTSFTCKDYVLAERAGRTGLGGPCKTFGKTSDTARVLSDVAARRGRRCATGTSLRDGTVATVRGSARTRAAQGATWSSASAPSSCRVVAGHALARRCSIRQVERRWKHPRSARKSSRALLLAAWWRRLRRIRSAASIYTFHCSCGCCCLSHLGEYVTSMASILAASTRSGMERPPIACVERSMCTFLHPVRCKSGWCPSSSASTLTELKKACATARREAHDRTRSGDGTSQRRARPPGPGRGPGSLSRTMAEAQSFATNEPADARDSSHR